MASEALLVAAFVGVWLALYGLGRLRAAKEAGFTIYPFLLIYRTKGAQGFLDRLAAKRRAVKTFGDISIAVSWILMAYAVWFLFSNLTNFFGGPSEFSAITLLIPGITVRSSSVLVPFFIAIAVILLVHEGAHGVLARAEGMRVKSAGFAIVAALLAGFVEPNDEDFKNAKPRAKMRVLAVGSVSNILFSFLLITMLLGQPTMAGHPPMPLVVPEPFRDIFYERGGVLILAVNQSLGAGTAGIKTDDVITEVKGVMVRGLDDYRTIPLSPGDRVSVKVKRGGENLVFDVQVSRHPTNSTRGILGIAPADHYQSRIGGIIWPGPVYDAMFWIWFLSLMIGAFNMLPLYPMDGYGLLSSALETRLPGNWARLTGAGASAFAGALLAGNLLATFLKFGPIIL